MEFDHDLLFNFVSIIATILLIFVTTVTVFQRLKLRWPLKVNCWFCNKDTNIWRQQLNWWLCPSCEQYNGFTKNGDYAYSIPEQYKAMPGSNKRYCTANGSTETNESRKGNLCKQCNRNESLKVLKLSQFEPTREKNYEYEVNQFKHSLEMEYPLCGNCKRTVFSVLQKQALWLTQYKMLMFKDKSFQAIVNNKHYMETIFRIISIILDSVIAYNMDLVFLPVCGLLFQLCACYVAPAKRRSSDILLAFLWICIIILLPFKDIKLLKFEVNNTWISFNYLTQYHVIMIFAFIIGFVNVKPKSNKSTFNKDMSFKRFESFTKDASSADLSTTITKDNQTFNTSQNSDLTKTMIKEQSSTNATDSLTPIFMDNMGIKKPPTLHIPAVNPESCPLPSSVNGKNNHLPPIISCKNNISDIYSVNDSLSTLSSLSLSEGKPAYTGKSVNIFERKVYNTKCPELFKKSNNSHGKKNILSPPKLKSVMQASWVAGGYWQEGIDAPSLSRSSSQSSGFGSAGSNFAPSREPSIHEFDQCSVMSDVAQPCYISRQNNMSPVGSFSHHSSQFSFTEPKSPIYNQTMNYGGMQNHRTFSPQPLLLPQNYQMNNTIFTDPCLQGQRMNVSDIKNPSEMQIFPSHTTIVTSPVWLPALLCGSLVLNIIVLCTTLSR